MDYHMTKTVQLLPEYKNMPENFAKEAATNVALDLVEALTKLNTADPFTPIGAEKLQALRQLSEISKQKMDPTKPLNKRHQVQG